MGRILEGRAKCNLGQTQNVVDSCSSKYVTQPFETETNGKSRTGENVSPGQKLFFTNKFHEFAKGRGSFLFSFFNITLKFDSCFLKRVNQATKMMYMINFKTDDLTKPF